MHRGGQNRLPESGSTCASASGFGFRSPVFGGLLGPANEEILQDRFPSDRVSRSSAVGRRKERALRTQATKGSDCRARKKRHNAAQKASEVSGGYASMGR